MSRHCNDCSRDGSCNLQKSGVQSCNEGSDKTKEQRIRDIDNRVLDVIEMLSDINQEYASWDMWDKTQVLDDARFVLLKEYEEELYKRYLATDQ